VGKRFFGVVAVLGALAAPAVSRAATAQLVYGGGPIMPSVDSVVVNWGDRSNEPSGYLDFVDKYFSDVAANSYATDDVFANDEQYQVPGQLLTHKQTFHGEYDVTPSIKSTTIDDTQIASELVSQIQAGNLPPPQAGPSTGYFVMIPGNTYTVTLQGSNSGQAFCDYHYSTTYNGVPVIYAVIMTWSTDTSAFQTQGCGKDANYLNNQTMNISHQQNEMITDPIGNTGWDDMDPGTGEISDICNQQAATNTLNGTTYTVQKAWSNNLGECVPSVPGIAAPTASFTSSTNLLTASFDGSGSSSPNGAIHSYAWSFGDGSSGGGAHVSHNYAAPGTYQVTLEVTDAGGFLAKTTQAITVSVPGGGGGSGGSGSGGGSGGGPPSVAQVDAALTQLLGAPQSGHATIPAVLAAGGFTDPFNAPGPGTVVVQWYFVPPGAHLSRAVKPVLVAQGRKVFSAAGRSSIKLGLTARGRSLLKHKRSVLLTAKATFMAVGGSTISKRRSIKLGRH
jgi:PKD repeat protein